MTRPISFTPFLAVTLAALLPFPAYATGEGIVAIGAMLGPVLFVLAILLLPLKWVSDYYKWKRMSEAERAERAKKRKAETMRQFLLLLLMAAVMVFMWFMGGQIMKPE